MELEKDSEAIIKHLGLLGLEAPAQVMEDVFDQARIFGNASWSLAHDVDEGKMLYSVDISGKQGLCIQGFQATLCSYSVLTSEKSIASSELETFAIELKDVEWTDHESDKEARALLSDMGPWLNSLPKTGRLVAIAMMAKGWLDTPIGNIIPQEVLSNICNTKYFEVTGAVSDYTARQAYNLLAGRSVLKFSQVIETSENVTAHWRMLKDDTFSTIHSVGYYLDQLLEKYQVKEYVAGSQGDALIDALIQGDKVPCHIPAKKGMRVVLIAADPLCDDLKIFLPDGTRLKIIRTGSIEQKAREKEIARFSKKNGRGLR